MTIDVGPLDALGLHALVLSFNINDAGALDVARAVLQHPGCERATALHLYGLLRDVWFDAPSSPASRLARQAQELLLSGQLPHTTIPYDPITCWGLNRVALHVLKQRGFPEALLQPCGPGVA